MIIIVVPFMRYAGMAIYPFILISKPALRNDAVLIRHEQIHLRQQLELLIIPFYLIYLLNYLYNLLRFGDHDRAYANIIFEKEAYQNEKDPGYLKNRQLWAWRRYF